MGTRSSLIVWFAALLVSASAAVAIIAELMGVGGLPETYASLIQDGPVTRAIMVVFGISLIVNAYNTGSLIRELRHLRSGLTVEHSADGQQLTGTGLLGRHVQRLYEIYADFPAPDARQDASLNAIRNQLFRREWLVRSASQLLLTLGLIGTVLGLTDSLGGLSSTVHAVGAEAISAESRDDLASEISESEEERSSEADQSSAVSDGLNKALGGMATAFLTTLFGAVLGGVCLKLLHNCTESLIEHLVDEIELVTETQVLPALRPSLDDMLRRQLERFEQWSAEFDAAADKELRRLSQVSQRIDTVAQCFDGVAQSIAAAEAQLVSSPGHLTRMAELETRAMSRRLPVYIAAASGCVLVIAGVTRIALDLFP